MNKEQLVALGLTDEQADKVVAGFGQMIPKSRLDEKIEEVKGLNATIKERDTQLEDLKKVDAKGLQAKIDELQTANETAKTEYESNLKDTQLNNALKLALVGKVHDLDYAITQIDKGKIELDADGNVTKGLDEQVTPLRETKSFLFVEKQEEKLPLFKGLTPTDGKKADGKEKDTSEDFGKNLAQLAAGNADLDKARDSYFG